MALPAATDYVHDDAPEHASDGASSRVSPRRRSRWRTLLWLLAIFVAVRLAFGIVLAPLATDTLSRVLGARVDVGDVSFAPIDAVVTLRNVVVHAADESGNAKPPVTAARVRIDVQWLPLLHRSVVVRQLTFEGARADLDRLRDAGWNLERFQRLNPASELPPGWSFALERIALRDTHVRPGDVTAGDVAAPDVMVRDARVTTRRMRASAFGRAPNLRVDAVVDGGRLLITGSSDLRDDGVAIDARINLKGAPLERVAAYRPVLVGSSVAGQVSGRLHYQRDPGRRDRLTGRLRGRAIAVQVPDLAEPALAIRRAEIGVDGIDLLQRRVAIGTLTVYGARLAVRPDLVAPVPLLDALARSAAEPPDPRRAPSRSAQRAASWTWTIGHLASPFARVRVAGAGDEASLAANVSGENLGPGAYWSPLRAWIGGDAGTAVFDGTARMTHGFTLEGRLTASDVDAVAVARAVGPPLASLVQAGRGAADLNVELTMRDDASGRPIDGRGRIDAQDSPLDVRGRIGVGDLWLAGPDPDVFAFGARAVELEIARVVPARNGSPTEIGFSTAALESPYLKLTHTAEGWPADATTPGPTEAEAALPAVALALTDVRARNGRLLVVDQAATPNLALDLATVDGSARDLRLPAADFGELVLQGTDRRLGAMRVVGAGSRGDLRAELSLPAMSLPAVAPYLQRAGLPYVFTAGTGAVRSRLWFAGDQWSADTMVRLVEATLGGDKAMLEQSLGMTPEAAFAALRERHGEVALQLSLGSLAWMGGHGLNETVAGAVREAMARPRLAAPIEVGFASGRAEPGPYATRQLAAIAEILAARPDIVVELHGAISREDRRWLAEQALAARETPDEPRGFKGWLRAVGFRDQETRIRDALAARGAGEAGRLAPEDEAALRDRVAAGPPVADERLASLADTRARLVANLLADRFGVIANRLVVAEPKASESTAAPVVDVRFVPGPELAPW